MPALATSFAPTLDLEGVESSYKDTSYGSLFYALVRILRPLRTVELGTYLGYSGLHMAAALRDNARAGSEITMIDLWDDYAYRHCSMTDTKAHFARNALLDITGCTVNFINADARDAAFRFRDASVDLLHIDISNDGGKLADLVPVWERKLSSLPNAMIVIEGGSAERDRIGWMLKYAKPPLRPWLEGQWVSKHFAWITLDTFPSVTMLTRRP
jgi:predicted O-methyltransferase YrrM